MAAAAAGREQHFRLRGSGAGPGAALRLHTVPVTSHGHGSRLARACGHGQLATTTVTLLSSQDLVTMTILSLKLTIIRPLLNFYLAFVFGVAALQSVLVELG